jgi:hypothetical protein
MEGSSFKDDSFIDALVALQNFKTDLYHLAILDVKMSVNICFLTVVSDVYYEAFGILILPNFDENCIIHKPIENESLISTKQLKNIKSI